MMIRFMTGILSMNRVMCSITHPSVDKFSNLPTNHHSHFFLFQLLSQVNEHVLSSSRTNLNLILPFSFSVHPPQERLWANTDGSQGFSRLIRWGYVHLLFRVMFLDGFELLDRILFVYIVMTLIVACLFGCVFTVFVVVTLYIPSCVDHLPKRHMMCAHVESFTGLLCIIVIV
jgi:hypothetical protein